MAEIVLANASELVLVAVAAALDHIEDRLAE
jgi:hypothetical protein